MKLTRHIRDTAIVIIGFVYLIVIGIPMTILCVGLVGMLWIFLIPLLVFI